MGITLGRVMRIGGSLFGVVLVAFFLFHAPDAMAQSYIGNFCWNITVIERETGPVSPETFLARFDVMHMGGVSYALQGAVLLPDDNPFVVTGAAHIIGSDIYMNLTGTQAHASEPWRDTGVMQVKLALSNLNGTFYEVSNDFNPSSPLDDPRGYAAGTVTFTSCP